MIHRRLTGPKLNNKKKGGWVARPEAKLVFPGLFIYVYIDCPDPKKARGPHSTGPNPSNDDPNPTNPIPDPETPTPQTTINEQK